MEARTRRCEQKSGEGESTLFAIRERERCFGRRKGGGKEYGEGKSFSAVFSWKKSASHDEEWGISFLLSREEKKNRGKETKWNF